MRGEKLDTIIGAVALSIVAVAILSGIVQAYT
jgi:hypothetical protein